ncbi:hypothetical protein C8R46DRAFT_1300836 [Mycena filopes]|nr:hypothetical protein C8R46DRAFT_1300836 [Mycena filopes]
MQLFLPALWLFASLLPTVLGTDPIVVQNECQAPLKLASFPDTRRKHASANMTTPLSPTTAWVLRQGVFGFTCKDGFTKDVDQCRPTTTPPAPPVNATEHFVNVDSNLNLSVSPACPSPFIISYASPSGPCGCVASINTAKVNLIRLDFPNQPLTLYRNAVPTRFSAAITAPPSSNGKVGCKNVSPGSKCSVDCDAGYKPSADETQCLSAHANSTVSEFDCGADAGTVGFLTADPVLGCVCKPTQEANFCGVAIGDPDAEMTCTDTTSSSGVREVKCAVKCTAPQYVANTQNKCEEAEAESSTLAGTATPRDSFETSCTDKIYKLPGKGGCKCAATPPVGGQECRTQRDLERSQPALKIVYPAHIPMKTTSALEIWRSTAKESQIMFCSPDSPNIFVS